VHDPEYVAAVEALAKKGGGGLDPDTWVSAQSFEVALSATGTVVAAAEAALKEGAPPAFVIARPPGHHARPAKGMGFCLFNNVAVAAAQLRAVHGLERVAILDFDVHHGNGTQEIFWQDPSVYFVSLHRDRFYPGTGDAGETGEGKGKGANLNLPLGASTQPVAYLDAFRAALDGVASFKPEFLLVSAGFDAYVHDPIGGLNLELEHFQTIGAELRGLADDLCGGRLVSTLEGGYAIDALGDLAAAYSSGLAKL
jgi:acetoin utilization deacetylase AcuC-like enzyme